MINLGVWLPPDLPMVELERWNNPGIVENCGKLGFQGRWAEMRNIIISIREGALELRIERGISVRSNYKWQVRWSQRQLPVSAFVHLWMSRRMSGSMNEELVARELSLGWRDTLDIVVSSPRNEFQTHSFPFLYLLSLDSSGLDSCIVEIGPLNSIRNHYTTSWWMHAEETTHNNVAIRVQRTKPTFWKQTKTFDNSFDRNRSLLVSQNK